MTFFLFLFRVVVGGVFIYSGWEKLAVPHENFMAVIEQYQVLRQPLIPAAAFLFPWVELILGIFLVTGFLIRPSASAAGVLLFFFLVLLARSLVMKLPIADCGCFGSGIHLSPRQALLLDAGLFLMCLAVIWKKPGFFSLDERINR